MRELEEMTNDELELVIKQANNIIAAREESCEHDYKAGDYAVNFDLDSDHMDIIYIYSLDESKISCKQVSIDGYDLEEEQYNDLHRYYFDLDDYQPISEEMYNALYSKMKSFNETYYKFWEDLEIMLEHGIQ